MALQRYFEYFGCEISVGQALRSGIACVSNVKDNVAGPSETYFYKKTCISQIVPVAAQIRRTCSELTLVNGRSAAGTVAVTGIFSAGRLVVLKFIIEPVYFIKILSSSNSVPSLDWSLRHSIFPLQLGAFFSHRLTSFTDVWLGLLSLRQRLRSF